MATMLKALRPLNLEGLEPLWQSEIWLFSSGDDDASDANGVYSRPTPEARTPEYEGGVLIIDDEADIRASLRGVLEDEGYSVTEAVDGIGGLALLRLLPQRLVVLLDYKMPRMNGYELLQAVIADPALAKRHAFLFITANLPAFQPELRQLLSQIAIPVLSKPFDIDTLLAAITQAESRLRSPAPDE